jgi:hypothetical protein
MVGLLIGTRGDEELRGTASIRMAAPGRQRPGGVGSIFQTGPSERRNTGDAKRFDFTLR